MRILHISDLHFVAAGTSIPKSISDGLKMWRSLMQSELRDVAGDVLRPIVASAPAQPAYARATKRALSSWLALVDLVIVTGDLAHTGCRRDLKAAEEFIRELLTEWRGSVESSGERRLIILPGNHDRYHDAFPLTPGGKLFDDVFVSYWRGNQAEPEINLCCLPGDEKVCFVSMDFSLKRSEWKSPLAYGGFPGRGKVYQEILDRATELSAHAMEERYRVVWLVHFAPEYPGLHWGLGLKDGRKLMARAKESGVTHILCGHTHGVRRYRCSDGPEIICTGTPCASPLDSKTRAFVLLDLEATERGFQTSSCRKMGVSLIPGYAENLGEVELEQITLELEVA